MHLTSRQLESLAQDVDDLHNEGMKTFAEETADLHLDALARRSAPACSPAPDSAESPCSPPRSCSAGSERAGRGARPRRPDDRRLRAERRARRRRRLHGRGAGADVGDVARRRSCSSATTRPTPTRSVRSPATRPRPARTPQLVAAVTPTLESITDETGALEFAFVLENQAAYTYAAALTLLQDPAYAAATATILPIEAQHAVVLGLALGKSVEDVFPTGAFESAALGDGTDPLAGLDPAVFPA